jgi:hypothetical protein
MSTVTYRSQPAIHKVRGAVPPEGTTHIYKVTKLLWPPGVESYIAGLLVGTSLHICCGKSKIGGVRLDMFEDEVDVQADAARLPFSARSFDTLLCDPPYNGRFQWNHDMLSELARVANMRVILQHWFSPVDKLGYFKKDHGLVMTDLYNWMPQTYFGRMQIVSIFDRMEIGNGKNF